MKRFTLQLLVSLPLLISLASCVGGTLSDTKDFEMYPLRGATAEEAKDLKHCLKTAHLLQEHLRKKTGKYARRVKDLPIDNSCGDFLMAQNRTPEGYEILAEKREDEHAVRWSVNQQGVIEEHLEDAGGDVDDQFMEF
jgi:hypothetical protein